MPFITVDLIRKKAEHHDGLLADLEELSLHQLTIERIETLDKVCRRLRILYLQNNLIPKIENVRRMKQLKYINLALNNITVIEGLDGCEKLERLDLTVNFIDIDRLEESLNNLVNLDFFADLSLMGNPCTEFPHYRSITIYKLKKIKRIDGVDVTVTERLRAEQEGESLIKLLRAESEKRIKARETAKVEDTEEDARIRRMIDILENEKEKRLKKGEGEEGKTEESKGDEGEGEKEEGEDGEKKAEIEEAPDCGDVIRQGELSVEEMSMDEIHVHLDKYKNELSKRISERNFKYSPEYRLSTYKEEEARKQKEEEEKNRPSQFASAKDLMKEARDNLNKKALPPADGSRPSMRNLGKYDFTIQSSPDNMNIIVDIAAPRFLDTSAIDVDIHPTWLQCIIKGKNLLLHLDEEVEVSTSKVQRIIPTGHLVITLPKLDKTKAINEREQIIRAKMEATSAGLGSSVRGVGVGITMDVTSNTTSITSAKTGAIGSHGDHNSTKNKVVVVSGPTPTAPTTTESHKSTSVNTTTNSSISSNHTGKSSTITTTSLSDQSLGLREVNTRLSKKLKEEQEKREQEERQRRLDHQMKELEEKEKEKERKRKERIEKDKEIASLADDLGVDLDELPDLE